MCEREIKSICYYYYKFHFLLLVLRNTSTWKLKRFYTVITVQWITKIYNR